MINYFTNIINFSISTFEIAEIEGDNFRKQIAANTMAWNERKNVSSFDSNKFCSISIDDARIIQNAITNNDLITEAIADAISNGFDFVIVERKYKPMLNEIQNRPPDTF